MDLILQREAWLMRKINNYPSFKDHTRLAEVRLLKKKLRRLEKDELH
jgi:hypothetical protein